MRTARTFDEEAEVAEEIQGYTLQPGIAKCQHPQLPLTPATCTPSLHSCSHMQFFIKENMNDGGEAA